MQKKLILCLDFDGVIHSYTSGWQGQGVIPDPPVEGAFVFIEEALLVFDVCIYSSRSKYPDGLQGMKDWFEKHRPGLVKHLSFPTEKPPAWLTIDDRAICFEGTFPNVKSLLDFKPWNKRNNA